ncbi:hypothetical protein [Butyrivibrio sp. JL13D10]|uniref:hypothetical protein n=1 Tax=Butyrivibrio sp. JL13D10 TaxID=3236815 RepID=UPI0038B449E6
MNTDEKFEIILNKLDTIDGRLDAMDGRLDVMDGRLDVMDSKISILEKDMSDVKSDVTSIKLQIENEIVPNTQRVAEGHQDLQRHLAEVVTYRSEYETLVLRVNHLESEVEKIQKKIC